MGAVALDTDAPWPALGVAGRAVIRRDDGRILLVKRASDVSSDAGLWELPGGEMDFGEALTHALAREILEETALTVRVGMPIHVTHFTKEPFWVTCLTFACELDGGEVRLSEEHDDFAWVGLAEVPGYQYARTIREQIDAYIAHTTRT